MEEETKTVETSEHDSADEAQEATQAPKKRTRRTTAQIAAEKANATTEAQEVDLEGTEVREFEENGKRWRKRTRNGSFVQIVEL